MGQKEIIVIGGSAGSINELMNVFLKLLTNFPLPIVIVVHRKISEENILTSLLQSRTLSQVMEVEDKMQINKGIIYIAPAGYHLLVEKEHSFSLDSSEKINFSRPNIDVTMQSIIAVYQNKVIGILLSGGNNDGLRGMQSIKEAGGMTIIQSSESSEMPIMPLAAEILSKANKLLSPAGINEFLMTVSSYS